VTCRYDPADVNSTSCGVTWWRCWPFTVLIIVLLASSGLRAQAPAAGGQVSTPDSSIEKPGDSGVRAHTNIQIYRPNRGADGGPAPPVSSGPGAPQPPPGTAGASGGARPQ